MKYSVVVFPSSKVQEVANSYRKRYDSHFALIPPFIRLIDNFETDEAKLPQLTQVVQQIASATDPFSITFHRASTFHPTSNVVFLAVQNKAPFEKLHQELVEIIGKQNQAYAFIPHLTIGRELTDDECKDVAGQLSMVKFDLTSDIDRIHLIKEMEDESWSVVQSFPFNQ